MAERSTSRTLPVNRPNDTKPDLSLVTTSDGADVTVKVRPGNQGGGDDNNVDAKASDTRKVGTKQPENNPSTKLSVFYTQRQSGFWIILTMVMA